MLEDLRIQVWCQSRHIQSKFRPGLVSAILSEWGCLRLTFYFFPQLLFNITRQGLFFSSFFFFFKLLKLRKTTWKKSTPKALPGIRGEIFSTGNLLSFFPLSPMKFQLVLCLSDHVPGPLSLSLPLSLSHTHQGVILKHKQFNEKNVRGFLGVGECFVYKFNFKDTLCTREQGDSRLVLHSWKADFLCAI